MKLHITIILALCSFFVNAQSSEVKFGKVSMDEVRQKEHSLDKEADAAILFQKERLVYDYNPEKGFNYSRKVHYRIKIYKKSGLSWSTITVPLRNNGALKQKIYGVEGLTFNIQNNKIVKDKLKKDGVFTQNINKYEDKVSITLPNVKEGSIIDIEYEIASDFVGSIAPFVVQYGIPVNLVDIKVEIPEYFNYKKNTRGFYPVKIGEVTEKKKIDFQYREERDTKAFLGGGEQSQGIRRGNLEYFETDYSITANNIPAFKEEQYTDNIENYRSAIVFELESTKFPSEGYRMYSQTWGDVANVIYKYDDFGGELSKDKVFRKDIDILISKYTDKAEPAASIYNYVKEKIVWDGYYGFGCENGFEKTLEEQKGNVADINLMLTSMLRYAGFKANPVLVSTKKHGIPLFPTTNGFNYVIAAIENDGDYILLDATNNMLAVNELPNRAINWYGRLVREDGTSTSIDLSPKKISSKTIFMNVKLQEDGLVNGNMRTSLTDNLAYDYRDTNGSKSIEDIKEEKSELLTYTEILNLEVKNLNVPGLSMVETISFENENGLERIGEKIYVDPMLFLAIKENPFKMEKREYPIDFIFPRAEKINISLNIPEGYKVEYLPENLAIGLPEGKGIYNFTMKENGNNIQLVSSYEIKNAMFSPDYYTSIKEFYNQIVQKQTEKVVLTKI
ncbi:transglutaminase domain-containing protein [Maribacter sp. SA7]|uniref:transglutaminase domain-containing protein n=1 Tax=Maribacter zhoushanensis TaxID=3030012 RepID=UPI0023EAE64A|nr:transglutaminase domain-containing protein [Maribacter zhoushanensis]MDF4204701.1 transglutaminase domain-containing protein [Maribacter zhoushanensis]